MDPDPDLCRFLTVEIGDLQSVLTVDRARLEACVCLALRALGVRRAAISLMLVHDDAMRAINARHLGHDYPTDVITFPLSEAGEPELSGEIVISTETAASVAASLGVGPERELALYAIHGVLHLCGHDDQDEPGRLAMGRLQEEILALVETQWAAAAPEVAEDGASTAAGGASCRL
jgi:probable rRNA maturation factor